MGQHWRVWESWDADRWVVAVLRFGYRVPFLATPPLSNVPIPLPSYSPSSIKGLALTAVVADLREKGAIEPAPPSPGYYSRLFVTPELTGGWRPVIDLSRLNRSVRVSHFHMETQQSVLQSASWGLDGFSGPEGRLRSGSSRVSLLPEILCRRGGLAISHSLFRPFDRPAGVHACHGPDFVNYALSRVQDPEVPRRLASPRVLVSEPGSGEGLSPMALPGARCPGQPGEELSDSHSDLGLPGDAALDASFEGFPDPQACPEARLSAFRLHLLSSAAAGSLASAAGGHVVSCLEDLGWWSDESHLLVGLPLGLSHPSLSLFTDASDSGWGASLGEDHISGSWSPHCSSFSINHRELLAVLCEVQGFLPLLRHRSLFADNTTTLAYLRNQGGTHSLLLNSVAQAVLRLCEVHRVRLVPQFIPGRLNVLADTLSRRSQVLGSEWTLCFPAFRDLLLLWPATIDLFATSLSHCLPVYFSPMDDPQSAGTDAMMQPWDALQAYVFPPFGLLQRVIAKVRQSRGLELTLVAPFWPQHPWFPDLLELLVDVPVFLPRRKDLLRQLHFHRSSRTFLCFS